MTSAGLAARIVAPFQGDVLTQDLSDAVGGIAREAGVDIVGFGEVSEALPAEFDHLPVGVSLGVVDPVMRLLFDRDAVAERRLMERALYDHRDREGQRLLEVTLKQIGSFLRANGYRYFCFPPDCDPMESPFTSLMFRRFSHKAAATCAGLGWVGRHGLLNHPRYGPQVAWATLVTNAPLELADPVTESACGTCRQCVEACPAGAITGRPWRRDDGMVSLVDADRCRQMLVENERLVGSWACGRCAVACALAKLGERPTE